MKESIILELPLPPNIGNGRQHWRVKLKAKKAYWGDLDILLAAKLLPWLDNAIWQARISAHLVVGGQMDVDNAFARLKWAIDWMKLVNYIADDSPKHLTWDGIPTQEVSRKKSPTVTFTITPIE